jgi:hypothetical protein
MERTPETDPALRTGGAAPAWTQLPQLNGAVRSHAPYVLDHARAQSVCASLRTLPQACRHAPAPRALS